MVSYSAVHSVSELTGFAAWCALFTTESGGFTDCITVAGAIADQAGFYVLYNLILEVFFFFLRT